MCTVHVQYPVQMAWLIPQDLISRYVLVWGVGEVLLSARMTDFGTEGSILLYSIMCLFSYILCMYYIYMSFLLFFCVER